MCFVIYELRVLVYPTPCHVGKFSAFFPLGTPSSPFHFSSHSGIPIIWKLVLLMLHCKSHRLPLLTFILFSIFLRKFNNFCLLAHKFYLVLDPVCCPLLNFFSFHSLSSSEFLFSTLNYFHLPVKFLIFVCVWFVDLSCLFVFSCHSFFKQLFWILHLVKNRSQNLCGQLLENYCDHW